MFIQDINSYSKETNLCLPIFLLQLTALHIEDLTLDITPVCRQYLHPG